MIDNSFLKIYALTVLDTQELKTIIRDVVRISVTRIRSQTLMADAKTASNIKYHKWINQKEEESVLTLNAPLTRSYKKMELARNA